MLKAVLIASALLVAATPATANEEVDSGCGTKVTWKAVKCALGYWEAVNDMKRAGQYEKWAKHAEVDGDTTAAQRYRNYATLHAAESGRQYMLWLQTYPKR